MAYYILKIIITAVLIVAISEIAKRNSFVGALLASIPLISVMAITWLYIDTKDIDKVSNLSVSVFWLVLPSLSLFLALPLLLKLGVHFYLSIFLAVFITVICYWLMIAVLSYYGVRL